MAAVLLASVRIVATYHVFNHTTDEPAHLACGIEYLDKGVYAWEPQHPPLARVALSIGPYLIGARPQNMPRNVRLALFYEGLRIFYSGRHYELMLSLARAGVLPFFWVACLVVYLWGLRYFSRAVAAAAVVFFSFLPPVLAHSGLATTDIALTAFLAAAFLAGRVWMERPSLANGALFGVATGLMVLSKFSCLVIWAGYRFSFGKVPFASFPLPAPELWANIQQVRDHNAKGHLCYLLGTVGGTGFWDFWRCWGAAYFWPSASGWPPARRTSPYGFSRPHCACGSRLPPCWPTPIIWPTSTKLRAANRRTSWWIPIWIGARTRSAWPRACTNWESPRWPTRSTWWGIWSASTASRASTR